MNDNRKAFFLGVSNDERNNMAYSNFIYSICYYCLKQAYPLYDIDEFNRHDMIIVDNIKESVYRCITEYDIIIVLLEEMPIKYMDANGNKQEHRMFNPNVWFELGIAATQLKKSIILISRDRINPFYVQDVQPCVISPQIENEYLWNNIDFFNISDINNTVKETWYNHWCAIFEERSQKHNQLKAIADMIVDKIKKAKNPFTHEMEIIDLLEILSPIGGGDIYKLLNNYVGETVAKFIPGEERAFDTLTEAISKAEKSLQTTRFANRSIVSGLEKNHKQHEMFMNALFSKAKEEDIVSERIICNNNYTKWKDVFEVLCRGGNTKVYIRKQEHSTYFELVIVDKKITFIHFYQLSTQGVDADEKKHSLQDHQVINSTLMLEGVDVAEHMSQVFERLYKRAENVPSRTLVGIPVEDERIAGRSDWSEYGVLSMPENASANTGIRETEVSQLLIDKFIQWYEYMVSEDRNVMCLGISLQVYRFLPFRQLLDFIKEQNYLDNFIARVKIEHEKVLKISSENKGYETLLAEFNGLRRVLENYK